MIIFIGTTMCVGSPLQTTTIKKKTSLLDWHQFLKTWMDACHWFVWLLAAFVSLTVLGQTRVRSVTAGTWIVTSPRPFPGKWGSVFTTGVSCGVFCFLLSCLTSWRNLRKTSWKSWDLDFIWAYDEKGCGQIKHERQLTKESHNCHGSTWRSALQSIFLDLLYLTIFPQRG